MNYILRQIYFAAAFLASSFGVILIVVSALGSASAPHGGAYGFLGGGILLLVGASCWVSVFLMGERNGPRLWWLGWLLPPVAIGLVLWFVS